MHYQTYALKLWIKSQLFSDTVSTLEKDYIESPDDFFIAFQKTVLFNFLEENIFLSRETVFQMNEIWTDKKNRFQESLSSLLN